MEVESARDGAMRKLILVGGGLKGDIENIRERDREKKREG